MPEQITQASENLRVAGNAHADAIMNTRPAEQAAKGAAAFDAEAAVKARQEGRDLPAATAEAKREAAETARRNAKAAATVAERAAADLERAIREHGAEWLVAQRDDAAGRAQDALDAVDQLETALDRLAKSVGIAVTLSESPPPGKAIGRGRRFKPSTIGFASHDGHASVTASALVADMREQIRRSVPKAPDLPQPAADVPRSIPQPQESA